MSAASGLTFLNKAWTITIRRDLMPDDRVYWFTDPWTVLGYKLMDGMVVPRSPEDPPCSRQPLETS